MTGRRDRKKEQTRSALLDAAMALFAERGVYGTRVEDVTDRVDLGKGAFYNYFASKDALVAELLAQGVNTFEVKYLSRMNGTTDIAARVSELTGLLAAFFDDHPQYSLIFHQTRGLLLSKETRFEPLRTVFADYLRGVGKALVQTPAEEGWTDDDLLDIAAAVVGGVAGYQSFRIAAALPPSVSTADEVLALGIAGLFERWSAAQDTPVD